jgi:hypothetical protein
VENRRILLKILHTPFSEHIGFLKHYEESNLQKKNISKFGVSRCDFSIRPTVS